MQLHVFETATESPDIRYTSPEQRGPVLIVAFIVKFFEYLQIYPLRRKRYLKSTRALFEVFENIVHYWMPFYI